MKLPPHRRQMCVGIDIYGVQEDCGDPVEPGSPFPYCARHRAALARMPRKRTCAGAVTYDAAMRPQQTSCNNVTGHDGVRLCASCRVIEAREKERVKNETRERCPHCDQPMPRSRAPLAVPPKPKYPPRQSAPTGGARSEGQRRPSTHHTPASRSAPTQLPSRPMSQPTPFTWREPPTSLPPPPKYEPEEE